MLELKTPTVALLPHYVDALQRGWTPDHIIGPVAATEQLAAIAQDADGFIARQTNLEALGEPVTLPDGSQVQRIPGRQYWIWDDGFCGRLSIRWQPGNAALPAHVLGHIGYSVVTWKRGQGCATAAVRQVLPYARAGPAVCRAHHRPRQPGVAESHHCQPRRVDRSLHQTGGFRQHAGPAFSHSSLKRKTHAQQDRFGP